MIAVRLRKPPAAARNSGASTRSPISPAQSTVAGDGAVRREAACACGGGCPRCAATPELGVASGPVVQRAPADGGSWPALPQDDPTSYVPEPGTDDDGSAPGDVFDEGERVKRPISDRLALILLGRLAKAPVGPPSGFTGQEGCPPTFCQPFVSKARATRGRSWAKPILLEGIRLGVHPRVVPLWKTHIEGGAPSDDKSATFGADFTAAPGTAHATRFLIAGLHRDVLDNRDELMRGGSPVTIDFTPRLGTDLKAINTPQGLNEMQFVDPRTVPGNLAGAIGKDQITHAIGALPSRFDDAREAVVTATLTDAPDGRVVVAPSIVYKVRDTVDLCPGLCGGTREQIATVPLSRFEASGISGDVPFTVEFPAPAAQLVPKTIPQLPGPGPEE